MTYQWFYQTPSEFDDIILSGDGEFLTGLYFANSPNISNYTKNHTISCTTRLLPIFAETCRWLDIYFSGKNPDFTPKYQIIDATPFRQIVSEIMRGIPFGQTLTYKDIAGRVAKKRGVIKMSSQAVGGAVGWNPICIIIPCHRVVGKNGNLTGYGGGMRNKIALLAHEGNNMQNFFLPKTQ